MYLDDKLIIETPEQTALEFSLAGIGSRALALALDTLLQFAFLALVGVAAGLIAIGGSFPQVQKQWGYAILIFAAFLLQFGYFAFFESIWNGQTPGKRWTHLRVITESGRPVGTQGAILRNLLRIVDALPTMYAVGILTSLISPQNKRVGDYVAGTVVIHEKPLQDSASLWNRPPGPSIAMAQPLTMTAAELQLVETFLERRFSFTEDVRRLMARQITERLSQGRSVHLEAIPEPEKFLEGLAEHHRSVARFR